MILHITKRGDWEKAQKLGVYSHNSLETNGFIHCSTPEQVIEVANLYLRGQKGLVLLGIQPEKVKSPVKYEAASGTHQFYPHIYGELNTDAVVDVFIFEPETDGSFLLPKELNKY
jgi:uncharacterized protein (DUF952 family)